MRCDHDITGPGVGGGRVPCPTPASWRVTRKGARRIVCRYHLYPAVLELGGGNVVRIDADARGACASS